MPYGKWNRGADSSSALDASGVDTRSIEIRTVTDQVAALKNDVASIQNYPILPTDLEVVGAIFDVKTGELTKII